MLSVEDLSKRFRGISIIAELGKQLQDDKENMTAREKIHVGMQLDAVTDCFIAVSTATLLDFALHSLISVFVKSAKDDGDTADETKLDKAEQLLREVELEMLKNEAVQLLSTRFATQKLG